MAKVAEKKAMSHEKLKQRKRGAGRGRSTENFRLKKLAKIVVEKRGQALGKSMVEAGYSEIYAKNPHQLTRSDRFKAEIAPILEQLELARQQALDRMKKTVNKAKYGEVSASSERLTKQIQLLKGDVTERVGVETFDEMSVAELNRLIEARNSQALKLDKASGNEKADNVS